MPTTPGRKGEMTSINPASFERNTPSQSVEHEETWTLVPDALTQSGWAVVFADGSFTRSWIPGQA